MCICVHMCAGMCGTVHFFFLDSIRVRLGMHDPMWHLYNTTMPI